MNPRPQKVHEEQKHRQATGSSSSVGVSNNSREENLPSRPQSKPSFASCFMKKLEDNTNCTTGDSFSKEKQQQPGRRVCKFERMETLFVCKDVKNVTFLYPNPFYNYCFIITLFHLLI
ncbi:unnamed protein product [Vicia faba]|uniref:Uncharacterized protein n=1 Tax=Vicia faba TaxID=3906 RepID=A0AAV0YDX8_VICFA|nr:unnamed protein product [Vicia faba]